MFKRRKPDEPPVAAAREPTLPRSVTPEPAARPEPPLGVPAMPAAGHASSPPGGLTQPHIKDQTVMSRPPLPATPFAQPMPQGNMPQGNMPQGQASPGGMSPGLARAPMAPARMPARDGGDRRTLVVGRGISVQGTIQDAERLVVEGTVEASLLHAAELQITQGGVLKGSVEVEDAEISGLMDGTLTVRGSLVVRGSGQITGEARCRRLQVEDGGQITGKISMITDDAPPARAAEAAAPG